MSDQTDDREALLRLTEQKAQLEGGVTGFVAGVVFTLVLGFFFVLCVWPRK